MILSVVKAEIRMSNKVITLYRPSECACPVTHDVLTSDQNDYSKWICFSSAPKSIEPGQPARSKIYRIIHYHKGKEVVD